IPGTLPPGGEGRIPIILRLKRCPPDESQRCRIGDECPSACQHVLSILVMRPDERAFLGWDALEPPPGMEQELWDDAVAALARRFAPTWPATWAGYGEGLAGIATRLARRGAQASSVFELFRFAVREALGSPTAALTGRLISSGTDGSPAGEPLAERTIIARQGDVIASVAETDSAGDFALDWLEAGATYEIAVLDHVITATSTGSSGITMPATGDVHGFDIEATPPAGPLPETPELDGANCDETGLPVSPLLPPAALFELAYESDLIVVNSWDPNEKDGSDDLGGDVPPEAELEYTVYFENEAEKATAPAQEIVIVDDLDPKKFDIGTFRIHDIRIGNLPYQFKPLSEKGFDKVSGYTESTAFDRLFGTDSLTVLTPVEIEGNVVDVEHTVTVSWEVDLKTGRAEWSMQSDTDNALAGVLPVNDDSAKGEGHISFSVGIRAMDEDGEELADGTELENDAIIQFDDNPSLSTQKWVNILRRTPSTPRFPRPNHGATGVEEDVVLQWEAMHAEGFDVYLWAEGENPPSSPVTIEGDRFYKPPVPLELGRMYLWRVTSRSGGQEADSGAPWSFEVREDSCPQGAPTPSSPAAGSNVPPGGVVLEWTPAAGAPIYAVFVWPSEEARPSVPVAPGVIGTTLLLEPLEVGREYSWQVVAVHGPECVSESSVRTFRTGVAFVRSDANADGAINITDPQFLLLYLFTDGPAPPCVATADANGDGEINITDVLFSLRYLFDAGSEPPAPFPGCGVSSEVGQFPCEAFPACE
ncbi:MAG: dockerin type I domain-containing protein, partial [Actinobacteria bacterium]|nr:dockerin type I domain-containing protein [Actinomycetota bacterium]